MSRPDVNPPEDLASLSYRHLESWLEIMNRRLCANPGQPADEDVAEYLRVHRAMVDARGKP